MAFKKSLWSFILIIITLGLESNTFIGWDSIKGTDKGCFLGLNFVNATKNKLDAAEH